MPIDRRRLLSLAILFSSLLGWLTDVGVARATVPDRTESLPRRAQTLGVVEHLGAQLPMQTQFIDSVGAKTTFGDQFLDGLPVIVTMNYSSCPMLCSLQLDGLVKALKQSRKVMGRDYRIVTVSFDPTDTPEKMSKMRARYLRDYGRATGERAWTMLVGQELAVRSVGDALGIAYSYNELRKEYLHPAAAVIASPAGKIARYLYGIEPLPKTVEWSLVEASNGRTVGSIDRLILYCFHYDATEGKYAPVAFNIMRVGGGITVLLLGSILASYWLFELRQRKRTAEVPT